MDPRSFWEDKIVDWEDGRYGGVEASSKALERIADKSSASLRFRLKFTRELLLPKVKDKSVIEIGCGSGFLTADIIRSGAANYVGFDIAESAIARAKKISKEAGIADKAEFIRSDLESLDILQADIVFSLGLLDWLRDDELDHLFRISVDAHWLHAIAERRASPSQWLHRIYVHLAYGHRTKGYVPRYYAPGEIEAIAQRYNSRQVRIFRDPRLSFGAMLSTLDD